MYAFFQKLYVNLLKEKKAEPLRAISKYSSLQHLLLKSLKITCEGVRF